MEVVTKMFQIRGLQMNDRESQINNREAEVIKMYSSGMSEKDAIIWALRKGIKEIEWLAKLAHIESVPSVVGTKGILEDAIKIMENME